MAKISDAQDLVLQQIRNVIDEDLLDFKSLQCPRCGWMGGLEALTGSTAVVTFSGCRHQIHGELAEAYLAKAFPGADAAAQRVIGIDTPLTR